MEEFTIEYAETMAFPRGDDFTPNFTRRCKNAEEDFSFIYQNQLPDGMPGGYSMMAGFDGKRNLPVVNSFIRK